MELGTRIRSAVSGGDVIATRSAVQATATGDARVIQLVDLAARQLADWQRRLRADVSADDPTALEAVNLPLVAAGSATAWFASGSDLSGLIRVGDCDRLVVAPSHTAAGGQATITPVVCELDESDTWLTPVALLEPQFSTATALQDRKFRYMAPVLVWDTQGASVLVLHVSGLSSGNTIHLHGGALAEVGDEDV